MGLERVLINDPNKSPEYSIPEVSKYLQIPSSTVRSWIRGREYTTRDGIKRFENVIIPADDHYVSFQNLIEIFLLSSIRKRYHISLRNIRNALTYLREHFSTDHPLADIQLLTDKTDLFIEEFGTLINLTRQGQIEMRGIIENCLSRIEKDNNNNPIKFFPYNESRDIVMNPRVQFGKPCIIGMGIPTYNIYDRFFYGEEPELLAYDYSCDVDKIFRAIEFEKLIRKKAA